MKKSLTIIALAALVMLAGCKKNDPKPNGTRLFAGIEKHKSDSKTSLNDLTITWSAGDQLYVNNGTDAACFTLTSNPGATSGEFATTDEYTFTDENVAVYPYNENITVGGTTVTMTLPAEQTASGEGSFGNGANPMLGTFSDMDNLTLKSLCGVLCLQLTGDNVDITAIEIVGGPDDKLNGTFTANYKDTDPVLAKSGDDGTNKVRLNFTETVTLTSTAQKFYVVVPAGTLHGLTMKVYTVDNKIFSKSTANPIPVYVNTLSTMDTVEVVPEPIGPLATPLTLEAQTDGEIVVYIMDIGGKGGGVYPGSSKGGPVGGRSSNANRKYSVNNGGKTLIDMGITTIPVNAGDKVQFYGNGIYGGDIFVAIVGCPAQTTVYGNIMSLINEMDYETTTTLQDQPGAFMGLFYMNANLTDASGLLLPATKLSHGCYYGMFQGCTSLTAAPELPATELAEDCYYEMFYWCTSLTAAPELPATELAEGCYYEMFSGCESLTAAPELPATELAEGCYYGMFYGCTNLSSITCLATEGINENESTYSWVNSVASTGTFTKASGSTWPEGVNGIPSGWTVNEQ